MTLKIINLHPSLVQRFEETSKEESPTNETYTEKKKKVELKTLELVKQTSKQEQRILKMKEDTEKVVEMKRLEFEET